tara:strand:- start:91 stop:687 length:597 start_codon:yes stop_codon:yes gene_type:complete
MTRKHKLRVIQVGLIIVGLLIVYYTYYKENNLNRTFIPSQKQKEIKEKIANQSTGDIFTNIEYAGIDVSGNRYVLKSAEAINDPNNKELVNLTSVVAFFYFKDNSILKIKSDKGLYNNSTLDMNFYYNIEAIYEDTKLYAQLAEFSNTNNNLIISDDVKVNSDKGIIFADKLTFDIKDKTLDIESEDSKKVNANINIK